MDASRLWEANALHELLPSELNAVAMAHDTSLTKYAGTSPRAQPQMEPKDSRIEELKQQVAKLKARLEKVDPTPPPPEPKRKHNLRIFNSANDSFSNSNRLELEVDCPVFANLLVNGQPSCNPDEPLRWTEEDPVPVVRDEFGEVRGVGGHSYSRSRNPTYNYVTIKCSCGLTLRAAKDGVHVEYELEEPRKQKQNRAK